MANLLQKKLAKQQAGTRLELTFLTEAGRVTAAGTIVDTDNEESLELQKEDGESIFVMFSEVVNWKLLTENSQVTQAQAYAPPFTPGTTQQTQQTHSTPPIQQTPPPVLKEQVKAEPASREEGPFHETIQRMVYSDKIMQDLFNELPKAARSQLSGAYNSFLHGYRNKDNEKVKSASSKLLALVKEQFSDSAPVQQFAGYIMSRAGRNEEAGDFLMESGNVEQAANAYFFGGNMEKAGTCLSFILEDPQGVPDDQVKGVFTMLEKAITKTNDLSFLEAELEQIKVSHYYIDLLLQSLAQKAGIHLNRPQSFSSDFAQLYSVYNGTAITDFKKQWLAAHESEKEEPVPEAPAEPAPEPVSNETGFGFVTEASWMQEQGEITGFHNDRYSFSFEDVKKPALKEKLQSVTRQELVDNPILVEFKGRGGKARDVIYVKEPVVLAKDLMRLNQDCEILEQALKVLECCPKTQLDSQCVELLLRKAIPHHKKYGDETILQRVKEYYLANAEKMDSKFSTQEAVVTFFRHNGEKERAARIMEKVVADTSARAVDRLVRRLLLIDIRMSILSDTHSADDAKEAWKQIESARQSYEATQEDADTNSYLRYYFRNGVYLTMAECKYELECYEEAEEYLKKVQVSYLKEAETTRLTYLKAKLKKVFDDLAKQKASEEKIRYTEYEEAEPALQEEPEPAAPDRQNAIRDYTPSEDDYVYQDMEGVEALKLTKKEIVEYALSAKGEGRLAVMLAYLKAGADLLPAVSPVYQAASLAVDNPLEQQNYSTGAILADLGMSDTDYPVFTDYCMASAALRSAFASPDAYSYNLTMLQNSIRTFQDFPELSRLFGSFLSFRERYSTPMDTFAAYRSLDEEAAKEKLQNVVEQARVFYDQIILNTQKDGSGVKRLMQTKIIAFQEDGPLGVPMKFIAEKNFTDLSAMKESFASRWTNGQECRPELLDGNAIDSYIDQCWKDADKQQHGFKLQGNRMNNLRSLIRKLLSLVCECYSLLNMQRSGENEEEISYYQHILPDLLEQTDTLIEACREKEAEAGDDFQQNMGLYVLRITARSLRRKMDGTWDENIARMCFAPFLGSDWILLKENFMPELDSTFCALPEFNVLARIRKHAEGERLSLTEHFHRIYTEDPDCHNFGTAKLIIQYLTAMRLEAPQAPEYAARCVEQAQGEAKGKLSEFRRKYALAIAVGQIGHGNAFLENAENMVRYWYLACAEGQNYGFLNRLIENTYSYIHNSASQRRAQLHARLESMVRSNEEQFAKFPGAEERIHSLIEEENFTVAEDEMNHLSRGEFIADLERPEAIGYLQSFWSEYDADYRQVSNLSTSMQNLFSHSVHNKEQKGAVGLIENWIKGGLQNEERVAKLLAFLGWTNITVKKRTLPGNNTEIYHVARDEHVSGRQNPVHLIAPFGSMILTRGFEVVCLYGAHDSASLLEKFSVLDGVRGGARLVLLDAALTAPDRRVLARKIKKRELFNTYLVLDRVLLCYLYNHYRGSVINRMLMSVGMPFSWYQPYVAESSNYMPPEMFIGRASELRRIEHSSVEQADSVNLIYGGRQLGKTALLKKAVSDLDGIDGKRAVIADLLSYNCAQSARRLSEVLCSAKLFTEDMITEDWPELIGHLRHLLSEEGEGSVSFLLIMLDEADDFIKDCETIRYFPITEMKKLQEEMPGRFKFVIAGLHDIVRFNRASSLGNNAGIPHLKSMPIQPFHRDEANQLLLEPLSYLGFILEDSTKATQIVAQTNYFPGLIQLYCQKLVESIAKPEYGGFAEENTPPYRVSNDLIGRVLADNNFIYEIRNKFEMTLRLEKNYYLIALLICHMTYDKENIHGYSAEEILQEAKSLEISSISVLDVDQVEALLQELQELNVLRREAQGTYDFASENFRGILGTELEILNKLVEVEGSEE